MPDDEPHGSLSGRRRGPPKPSPVSAAEQHERFLRMALHVAAMSRLESMPSDRIERLLDAGIFDGPTTLAARVILRQRRVRPLDGTL